MDPIFLEVLESLSDIVWAQRRSGNSHQHHQDLVEKAYSQLNIQTGQALTPIWNRKPSASFLRVYPQET